MQERNVLILVVVLVAATAGAGVLVNALRSNNASTFEAFYLSLDVRGTPAVGSNLTITVRLQQAFIDSRTLPSLFLSVDVGTLQVRTATPGTNPWDSPTVWNLTGRDLSSAIELDITASPTVAGPMTVYAMVWVPLGSLGSVTLDASGHVNPAGITLMASSSAPIDVSAAA
jgi:hypothetical protein